MLGIEGLVVAVLLEYLLFEADLLVILLRIISARRNISRPLNRVLHAQHGASPVFTILNH